MVTPEYVIDAARDYATDLKLDFDGTLEDAMFILQDQGIMTFGEDQDLDESMDGDFDSAMASAGHGTDEDYGCYE